MSDFLEPTQPRTRLKCSTPGVGHRFIGAGEWRGVPYENGRVLVVSCTTFLTDCLDETAVYTLSFVLSHLLDKLCYFGLNL